MSLPQAAIQALADFARLNSWEQRARLLLHWGGKLEPLKDSERSTEHLVEGCESQVWLIAEQRAAHWHFRADSQARLLRGLLALLLARCNGLSQSELASLDILQWFSDLGLERQLSPSRSNGLHAVMLRMRSLSL